mmetsp:Transcript_66639/g.124589  ORF Transcript_66639/g.124589 Transcript_66639/m.124589 type:complete len:81 (-) Transcript_66639:371-613(-)
MTHRRSGKNTWVVVASGAGKRDLSTPKALNLRVRPRHSAETAHVPLPRKQARERKALRAASDQDHLDPLHFATLRARLVH